MENTTNISKPYAEFWTIAEDNHISESNLWDNIEKDISLFLHPLQIGSSIRGNNLFEFFKEKNVLVLNANIWQYLKDNPGKIPESWKYNKSGGAQYVFFWGTIDRSNAGDLYVRYISWSGGNWVFSNFLLSGNWHEDFPAAILGNVTVGI